MFTEQEKKVALDAFNVYMQVASSNAPPSQVRAIAEIVRSITQKIVNSEVSGEPQKLPGITDEQFENVCKSCESLKGSCTSPVAIKFPGKCDPILKYERNKPKVEDSHVEERSNE